MKNGKGTGTYTARITSPNSNIEEVKRPELSPQTLALLETGKKLLAEVEKSQEVEGFLRALIYKALKAEILIYEGRRGAAADELREGLNLIPEPYFEGMYEEIEKWKEEQGL